MVMVHVHKYIMVRVKVLPEGARLVAERIRFAHRYSNPRLAHSSRHVLKCSSLKLAHSSRLVRRCSNQHVLIHQPRQHAVLLVAAVSVVVEVPVPVVVSVAAVAVAAVVAEDANFLNG